MKLSIIIPVYNVEKYVEKCIRSCENQNIPKDDYEVIVVNDGSPDGSLTIVERVAKEYPNIKVISQENGGLSAARNTGMQHADGEYYMFVDSDDWIEENCLGKLIKKIKDENPDALAICAANIINGEPKRRQSYLDETPMTGQDVLLMGISLCAPFSIWKSSFLKNNNLYFYKGIFHEDTEFSPRAYYLANKVSFTNDIIYFVYQNPTSITRTFNPKKEFDKVFVARRLHDFELTTKHECKRFFDDKISQIINGALSEIEKCDITEQERFNKVLYENRDLMKHFVDSPRLHHKVQGLLFFAFPKRILQIHKNMNIFKCFRGNNGSL